MRKISMLFCLVLFASGFIAMSEKQRVVDSRPNILLIVSEDNSPHLSSYGDSVIKTPHLDKIASGGLIFKNAYVTQSVCSPSRSSILTGLYPHQNGHLGLTTHGHRLVGDVKNIYGMLKEAGYRTGMIGKLHVDPATDFPIDYHPLKEPNYEKLNMKRYSDYALKFMKESDEPFFLMVNLPDTHWPFQDQVEGRPVKPLKPKEVKIFPYIGFDNEIIRGYVTSIYNCLLRLDECIGELMVSLEGSGKKDNTLVIYLSDHGDEMARGKFDIYEIGTKVPFMVNWPGKVRKGVHTNSLVSSVDIVPTLLDAAGIKKINKPLAGKSLLPLFNKPSIQFRDYLFTEKNADQIGLYFPRRAVRDARYKLIYSLLDDRENPVAKEYMANENRSAALAGSPTVSDLDKVPKAFQQAYLDWLKPSKVQLYDLQADPFELKDLSSDPTYSKVKARLFRALQNWQQETNDPLRFQDKLDRLTAEHDTMKVSKNMRWHYPEYLYGKNKSPIN